MRVVLTPVEWLPRRDRHRSRVTALLGGYLRQRGKGTSNPVIDFLFTYYNLTAGQLRRWHPGFGVTLTGPESHDYANLRGYSQTDSGVTVQPMVKVDGYELILGSSVDPQFGPVVLFGSGGQLVEVYRDRALALPRL